MHPSPLASHPFRIPTPCFSDLDIPSDLQYSSRPMSELNVAGTRTSYLGGDLHDTVRFGENVRRRRSRDDVAALIEFLRTHEPPPDNFMSQPYTAEEEEERGRWDKLKVMGKKRSKSMSRAPAPMRLPDSAVAGVTTGGHRHIAISIPLDASHFGETSKSQYPVPDDKEAQPPIPPLPESVRTFKNDRGVVTVLRPLSPSNHNGSLPASPTSPRRFDRDYPPQLLRNRRMMSSSPPPPSPAESEQWPLARTASESSSNAQPSPVSSDNNEESRDIAQAAPRPTSEFVRAAYPTRGSSMAAKPRIQHHHASSIDEMIADEEPYNRNPSPMPREGVLRRNTERRVAHPPVSLATSAMARKSASNLRSEWRGDKETTTRQPRAPQVTDSPVVNRNESPSPPASIISVKSRREKVRDKKLRDLAAARGSKLANNASHSQFKGSDQAASSKSELAPADDTASSGPKLSSIMVVVDMKPDGDEGTESSAATLTNDDTESITEMLPEPVMKLPTPPTSTETSPAQKHGFDTRTSLTRRREWQTNRAQDRQKREANAVAKAQLRQLAASGTYAAGFDAAADPEREIFRLYEAYREQRLHDMESRVRRLEKNGDVWLRALLPMLEEVNINAKLAAAQKPRSRRPSIRDDESVRDWASDDETASNVDRLQRAEQRRKLIRRASLSRERMLEELMRREERDMLADYDDKQNASSATTAAADASGMGSIEPLMRELAGGQQSQKQQSHPERGSNMTQRPRSSRASMRKVSDDAPPIPLRARPSNSSIRA